RTATVKPESLVSSSPGVLACSCALTTSTSSISACSRLACVSYHHPAARHTAPSRFFSTSKGTGGTCLARLLRQGRGPKLICNELLAFDRIKAQSEFVPSNRAVRRPGGLHPPRTSERQPTMC